MDPGRSMSIRQQQVARVLMAEVSDILRTKLRDPRLGFITLLAVEPSPDLRHARVFVSVLGDDVARRSSMEALAAASGYIRSLLGKRVELRYTPELNFILDEGVDRAARVEQLLSDISREGADDQSEDRGGG